MTGMSEEQAWQEPSVGFRFAGLNMKQSSSLGHWLLSALASLFLLWSGNALAIERLLQTPDSSFEGLPDYDFEPHYVPVDDPDAPPGNNRIRVHYIDEGPRDTPTVLMMNGNPSWSFLFRKIIPLLNDAGYRTIAVDYVGMGRSDKPSQPSGDMTVHPYAGNDYTYERHIEWMAEAISDIDRELDLGPIVFLGHDYGAYFGHILVERHFQTRFDGFITANVPIYRGEPLPFPVRRWKHYVVENPDFDVGAQLCSRSSPPCSQAVVDGYNAPFAGPEPEANYKSAVRSFPWFLPDDASAPEAIANQSAFDFMAKEFTSPYMVIWNKKDRPDGHNYRNEYISSFPGALGIEHPQIGSGYYSMEDNPDLVAKAVVRFLDDIYLPREFSRLQHSEFISDLDGFMCRGADCSYSASEKAIMIRGDHGDASSAQTTATYDLVGASELKVTVRFLPEGVKAGDDFFVEMWDGSSWVPLLRQVAGNGKDMDNRSTDHAYARVSGSTVDFPADAKVRIRSTAESGTGAIHVKEVGIWARY